jgi:hypothetical protein
MKTYKLSKSAEHETQTNLWEEFTQYLDSIYFEGAVELLDKELVSFEYNNYISCYSS